MRAVVVLAIVVAASLARAAPSATAVGFEHNLHDRDLVVSGAESLPCSRCHAMRGGALVGRPDHAACFGSCHGPPPTRATVPTAVCTACHAEAALAAPAGRRVAVHYPPYTLEPNFAVTVGHRRHRELACATCHAAGKTAPHRRCAGCHDGSGAAGRGPAMTACTGCHTPATGRPMPPSIVPAEINVIGAFAHPRHARHSAGARCTTCHAAVTATDDNLLPAPTAATCATARCHDGAAAFAITAACTRCHKPPPAQLEFKVDRPAARYSHADHAAHAARAGVTLACATCHAVAPSGEVAPTGHAPCVACHADDFGRRQPRICGACHNGTEPWRALVADRGPAERTEFGASLDHDRHPGACTGCHALTVAGRALRPPRGHRACAGAGCHAAASGPVPRLTACEACHQSGRALARQTARLAAPWSVRARFDHASHATTSDAAVVCTACHVDLRAPDVAALPTPPKATCAPCHDGTVAFKLTGTTCTRCHQGATP